MTGRHEALVLTAPDTASGVPTGVDDWRLVVELALPSTATVWGVAEWDVDVWANLVWTDVTEYTRGVEIRRGADEPHGRPRVGTITLTLDGDGDRFSSWNITDPVGGVPGYFAPGTIVRVGVRSSTATELDGWIPLATGIVDSWEQDYEGVGADRPVTVVATETLAWLANIDEDAVDPAVGYGETPAMRLPRLLAAADWPFGYLTNAPQLLDAPDVVIGEPGYSLAETTMAGNRLAEVYLTADACDGEAFTDATGRLILCGRHYIARGTPPLDRLGAFSDDGDVGSIVLAPVAVTGMTEAAVAVYDADSLDTANDLDGVINDVRLQGPFPASFSIGPFVSTFDLSVGRYGRRTFARNDMINGTDALLALQDIADRIAVRRGGSTLRVEQVNVHHDGQTDTTRLALAALAPGDRVVVFPPGTDTTPDLGTDPHLTGWIRSLRHQITPLHESGVWWVTSIAVDTNRVENIPSAQLDPPA